MPQIDSQPKNKNPVVSMKEASTETTVSSLHTRTNRAKHSRDQASTGSPLLNQCPQQNRCTKTPVQSQRTARKPDPTLMVLEGWHLMWWDTLAVWFIFQDPGQCTTHRQSSKMNQRSSLLCWTWARGCCCCCCLWCFCGCCCLTLQAETLSGWRDLQLT